MSLDRGETLNQGLEIVRAQSDQKKEASFGALVFQETLRRSLRKTPQERLEMLCASLRDAEMRGMIPRRDRREHEKQLLWLIQHASSKS
jgi:hypothetical protein